MAQKVQVVFIDDLDGSEATGTVKFGLDGVNYEIDLNSQHEDEFRRALAPFTAHARKAKVATAPARGQRARHSREQVQLIREWAKDNGFDVKDRGRVPADVVAEYQQANGAALAR